ncbi:hypothetical protein C8R43DRAFT_969989 [Mycena crocata]|nr:hypothetical protein C8R43DRAFT_969989 [Mycena crocata]
MQIAPTPLEDHIIITILHYISPEIQPLPKHLVASQLLFRHKCLNLTPDDPAYLFWPSADDQQVIDALESLQQRPIDDMRLDFRKRYTLQDQSVFAHADLAPDDPTGLRVVFQWEEDSWKYHNVARMPFPTGSSASLDDLSRPADPPTDGDGNEDGPDSYWDSYGEPDREESAAEFEREEPGSGSYWDMYNSVQGSGDSVIPSPAPEKQRHDQSSISFSYADMHPATDPMESLSDRLEALSQRPPLPLDDDATTVIDSMPTVNGTEETDLKATIRGVYRLWSSRPASTLMDREMFLRVVQEVLAEA